MFIRWHWLGPCTLKGASSQMQAGLPGHACGEGATPTLSAPFGAAVDLWWPDPGSLQKLGEP